MQCIIFKPVSQKIWRLVHAAVVKAPAGVTVAATKAAGPAAGAAGEGPT